MALPQNLSPLELLAQRSRNLATRLQDPNTTASGNGKSPLSKTDSQHSPPVSRKENDDDSVSTDLSYDDEYFDQNSKTSSRDSYCDVSDGEVKSQINRPRHKQSTASIGSILGDFRLSTFSIIDKELHDDASIRQRHSTYNSHAHDHSAINRNSHRMNSASHVEYRPTQDARGVGLARPQQPRSQSDSYAHQQRVSGIFNSHSGTDKNRSPHMKSESSLLPSQTLNRRVSNSSSRSSLTSSTGGHILPTHSFEQNDEFRSNRYSESHARALHIPATPGGQVFHAEYVTRPSSYSPVHSKDRSQGPLARGSSVSSRKSSAGGLSDSRSVSKSTASHNPENDSFEALEKKRLNNTLNLEEHVSLGIFYHEKGNLRESSYHWQFAAFQGELTAMLLYGLALRHGWGIRQNPGEAVKWLRKAIGPTIDNKSLEDVLNSDVTKNIQNEIFKAASSEEAAPGGPKKVKKAQVALALYELGMCYLNSWGIEKDEDMALRCFEVAGSMGDVDALSEAAGLWMHNGPKGRKKNLIRAAKLYRTAGEKGANMVSNSWIYKDKYMGEEKKKGKK